ncbi:hypothetical protein DENSPDRAFT_849588 [Dentipellis sp. KUC8613]|nr:hypothetical protein DENSPDRAFT_849588 [Dentipellis sp. KUC8613]
MATGAVIYLARLLCCEYARLIGTSIELFIESYVICRLSFWQNRNTILRDCRVHCITLEKLPGEVEHVYLLAWITRGGESWKEGMLGVVRLERTIYRDDNLNTRPKHLNTAPAVRSGMHSSSSHLSLLADSSSNPIPAWDTVRVLDPQRPAVGTAHTVYQYTFDQPSAPPLHKILAAAAAYHEEHPEYDSRTYQSYEFAALVFRLVVGDALDTLEPKTKTAATSIIQAYRTEKIRDKKTIQASTFANTWRLVCANDIDAEAAQLREKYDERVLKIEQKIQQEEANYYRRVFMEAEECFKRERERGDRAEEELRALKARLGQYEAV